MQTTAFVAFVSLITVASCTASPPRSSQPSAQSGASEQSIPSRTIAQAPPERSQRSVQPETQDNQSQLRDVPEPPWTITYGDGSGNSFRFAQPSSKESASYAYSPVVPERSSSGTYSGGSPASGLCAPDQTIELWHRVRRLEAETMLQAKTRAMGTGAFRLVTQTGERAFVVRRSDELAEFDAFVKPFRAAPIGAQPSHP